MQKSIHVNYKVVAITIICCLLFLIACSPAPQTASTPTQSPTVPVTPSSTSTLVPTSTVPPSLTSLPTATSTPLVTGFGQVLFGESFDDLQLDFEYWGPGRIESGVLVMEREKRYRSPEGLWPYGAINTLFSIPPGTTTLVLFQAKNNATINIGYHSGNYGEDSLRRFSYNSGESTWDWYYGNPTANGNYPIKQWRARPISMGVWYYFSIKRSENGDIEAKIWQQGDPNIMFQFHENLGPEWSNLKLTFFADYHKGALLLDEFQDLQ